MSTKPVLIIDGNPVADITEQAVEDSVSIIADGVKTLGTLMSDFYSLIDFSKVTENSYITLADRMYRYNSSGIFVCTIFSNTEINILDLCISSITANCGGKTAYYNGTTWQYIDNNNNVFGNGTVITLHYGSASIKADFETHANKCMMPDGTTNVAQVIDEKTSIGVINITGIYLNDLTWSQDSAGKYYALIQRVTSIGNGILISAIITEFSKLKATDVIQLYWLPGTSDIKIMSNVNSFTTNAQINVRLAYVKE